MFRRKNRDKSAEYAYLHHRFIRCVSAKDAKTYCDRILGREGNINIADGELIIVCQNVEVLRRPLEHLEIAELMSHDGFTVRDLSDPDGDVYTVYYTK